MIADRHDNVRGQAHEEIRTTTVIGAPHPRLRSMVRAYGGHPVTATPRGNFVLPAAAVVQLVFKLVDSRSRPPEFLIGSRPSRIPIDGTCAPSYIELSVDPLAAYTLLDTPGIEFRGQLVDLGEVVGSRAHDLAERIRDQATWRGRFDLLDAFSSTGWSPAAARPLKSAEPGRYCGRPGEPCRSVGSSRRWGGATNI